MSIIIMGGDCLTRLAELPADSLDSCCTDPPYHLTSIVKRFSKSNMEQPADKDLSNINAGQFMRLARGFMGQQWDGGDVAFRPDTWRAVYRVLKPGAWLAAFAAPRNNHRMISAIEDAGFEVRDGIANLIMSDYYVHALLASLDPEQQEAFARCIHDSPFGGVLEWVFGQGFPKSDDAERSIAKMTCPLPGKHYARKVPDDADPDDHVCPVTPESAPWQGFGTALKPAHEPICLARKPLRESSVAANLLRHGTGALNIAAGRVEAHGRPLIEKDVGGPATKGSQVFGGGLSPRSREVGVTDEGRHPANLILTEASEVLNGFPSLGKTSGQRTKGQRRGNGLFGQLPDGGHYGDSGSASRFFYTAKPDAAERHEGCRDLPRRQNPHPTVKPIDLMCYIVGQITPPGGTVLDPFLGSGTTAIAAAKLQMSCIGIEWKPEYVALAERRIHHHVGLFADLTIDPAPPAREVEEADAGAPTGKDEDGKGAEGRA